MTSRRTRPPVNIVTARAQVPPQTDRMVPVRKVSCPQCGAAIGEPCLSATGKKVAHRERRRKAIREGL